MKHMAAAFVVIVVGAFISWLALGVTSIVHYDPTKSNE